MRLEHPRSGKIQQGAFFNCALVSGYEGCPCHGIVLTARCDLEHDKHTIINYLPIVRFTDWSHRDMCYALAKRIHKSVYSSITSALDRQKVSRYIQDTFPLRDIILKETTGKQQESLLERLGHLEVIERIVALGGRFSSYRDALVSIDQKAGDAIVKDLIQGRLAEYYFIGSVDVNEGSKSGYVVLLRRMQTLSCDIMRSIVAGLEDHQARMDSSVASALTFDHAPICMITGVLRSPDVEHLAQQFANQFVRIGLEDHEDVTITYHQQLVRGLDSNVAHDSN